MDTILTRIRQEGNGVSTHTTTKQVVSAADEVASKYERIAKANEANRKRREEKRAEEERQFQAEMALPVAEADITLCTVRAGDVMFDRRYQTADRLDMGRAKRMARTYDPHECKPIDLNIRPGDPTETIWCFDGQHRVEATKMRYRSEDVLMEARVHRVSYQQEASLFAKQHDNVKPVPFALRFNAEIEAGSDEALAAKALADRLGLTLGRRARDWTVATTTFLECCRIKGLPATEEGIGYVLGRWKGSRSSLESHVVKGLVWFVANRRDDPNYDPKKISQTLARIQLDDLESEGQVYHRLTGHEGIAAALVDQYNRNRQRTLADWKPRGER